MKNNISFEHSLRHSFMHIKNMDISSNAYETRLLKETQVPGTLKLNMNSDIDETILSYDISGLESMEKFLENHSLSYSEISMLIENLNTLLGSLEEYMISENSVSLTPSTIFYNPEKREWNFTVIPDYKNQFHQDLSCFLSYLLKHINYNDDRAVIMGYSLFQESNKEFYQITDLLRIVRANMAKEIKSIEAGCNLDSENTAAQTTAFAVQNSMHPYHTSSCRTEKNISGPLSSDANNTLLIKSISDDGIFRPIDAGIILNSQKDTEAPLYSYNVGTGASYQAYSGIPQPQNISNNIENHTKKNINNDSYTNTDISFSSDYGKDAYLPDDPVKGVEIHDISKQTGSSKTGLFSFPIKNRFESKLSNPVGMSDTNLNLSGTCQSPGCQNNRPGGDELPKNSATIKDHLEENNKSSSLKIKILISLLLMLLIPSLVWFLKGGLIFKKALPLIIALEIGLSMMIALDFIMNKLPDESVE